MTIFFGTGHRPEDCNVDFAEMVSRTMKHLRVNTKPDDIFISGMASGFDLAFGIAAMTLDAELWLARPWAGHKARMDDVEIYEALMGYATNIKAVNPATDYPGVWVYHERNRWMVDNADEGIAFWNGKRSGGTFGCLEYADKKNVHVTNIYPNN